MFYRRTIRKLYNYIRKVDENENISFEQAILNSQNIGDLIYRMGRLESEIEEIQEHIEQLEAKKIVKKTTTKKTKGK